MTGADSVESAINIKEQNGQSKVKFIKHRTDYICRYTEVEWNHVQSEDNPADAASRGISSSDLISFNLWWNGPNWLKDSKEKWPSQSKAEEEISIHTALTTYRDIIYNLLEKYSCIQKLKRVICYIARFINMKTKNTSYPGYLSVKEIKCAEQIVIKKEQAYQFRPELNSLSNNKEVKMSSKILSLHPFIDQNKILRVGGRLQNYNTRFEIRDPIILDKGNVSSLIIEEAHDQTLHGGINLMRTYIQTNYWIFELRNSLKKN